METTDITIFKTSENGVYPDINDAPAKAYAVDIKWDTDGEDAKDLGLPSRVEIPFFVYDDEIADYLSDEYGYCVFGFNIEQV